ncbi:uncharacterized protein [Diadema setosum]|uniref:uncharacterized protein n=1 Tax=Diadema setosum TaxID=31175 RepID=UPI003B3B00B6
MHPHNRSSTSADRYKSLIDARVPSKDNSGRKGNDNSHFYSSRVKYCLEMAATLGSRALIYSVDNKNKIRVGDDVLAVDRRIQIQRVFPIDDRPQYLDHDFPVPGYHITPCGYLQLLPISHPETALDQLGRQHYRIPEKSTSTIVLRGPHSTINVSSHLHDMADHLDVGGQVTRGKHALFLVADGGPDFNVNHATNWFFYGRFFREMNLDALVVTSFCPGDSAMNPIEHLWAPCTRRLTGVALPSSLPGEMLPPSQQRLEPEDRLLKEHRVFNLAMDRIKNSYWKDLTFAGNPVTVVVEESGAGHGRYGADYQEVKQALGGSARQLRSSGLNDEYQFVVGHMDKRIGMAIFTKCKKPSCGHCRDHPPSLSAEEMDHLRKFPSPAPSLTHEGHFKTFIESHEGTRSLPCQHMPAFTAKQLGRCSEGSCRYVFGSKKDRDDHRRKYVHHR